MDGWHSPENIQYRHNIPYYKIENGEFKAARIDIYSRQPPMGPLRLIPSVSEGMPENHWGCNREIMLLSGAVETIVSVVHMSRLPRYDALRTSGEAITEAFAWALLTNSFADTPTPSDEERAVEIGTIHAAALAYGLTDSEALLCYNTAFLAAKRARDS